MPPAPHITRTVSCNSLATKISTYVSEVGAQEDLGGLAEYATDLARNGDARTLVALSREVDTWLREVHTPSDALLIVAKMKNSGVFENHLPVLASARRLRAIAERGSIKEKAEAELVMSVFNNPALKQLLHVHESALGAALDAWEIGRASAEASQETPPK